MTEDERKANPIGLPSVAHVWEYKEIFRRGLANLASIGVMMVNVTVPHDLCSSLMFKYD